MFSHLSQANLVPQLSTVINICDALVRIPQAGFCTKKHKNFTMQHVFHQLNMFSNQNLKLFPIHTICYQHIVMKMLSVHKYLSPWSFLQRITGTGKQFSVNPWQRMAGNYTTV